MQTSNGNRVEYISVSRKVIVSEKCITITTISVGEWELSIERFFNQATSLEHGRKLRRSQPSDVVGLLGIPGLYTWRALMRARQTYQSASRNVMPLIY